MNLPTHQQATETQHTDSLTYAQILRLRSESLSASSNSPLISPDILSMGFGAFGNLNQSSSLDLSLPQPMLDLYDNLTFQSHQTHHIACALWHTLFVTTDGALFVVGRNRYGALGNETIERQYATKAKRSWVGVGERYASVEGKYAAGNDEENEDHEAASTPTAMNINDRTNWDAELFTLNIDDSHEKSSFQHQNSPSKRVTKAAAGKYHSVIITQDNCLLICGLGCSPGNNSALLAEWENITSHFPVALAGCFTDISAGEFHTLVVMENGVFAWGRETRLVAEVEIPKYAKSKVAKCSTGKGHGVVLTAGGEIYMYGSNDYGQLDGSAKARGVTHVSQFEPVRLIVPPVVEEEDIKMKRMANASGGEAITEDEGSLTQEAPQSGSSTTTTSSPFWKDVACGENFVLALDSLNRIFFWGSWFSTTTQKRVSYDNPQLKLPHQFAHNLDVKQLVCTQSTFGFLTTTGKLVLAGNGEYGTLGTAKKVDRIHLAPVDELIGLQVDEVFAGGHSIFLRLSSSALMDIDKMRSRHIEESHDVVLVSGNEECKAHRCILAARSLLLREMLTSSQDNNTTILNSAPNLRTSVVQRLDVSEYIPAQLLEDIITFMYRNYARTLQTDEFMSAIAGLKMGNNCVMAQSIASGSAESFRNDIDKLRIDANELLHDVIFVLDDENAPEDCQRNEDGDPVIYAHRVILAARCVYFHKMLYGSMMESQQKVIPLIDARYEGFSMLMKMFYTNDFSLITPETAVEMLDYGNRFDWRDLQNQASRVIVANIDVDNCFQILKIGELFESETLQRRAIVLIALHPGLDTSEDFEQLSEVNKENVKDIREAHTRMKERNRENYSSDAGHLIQELSGFVDNEREYLAHVERGDEARVGRILHQDGESDGSARNCAIM